MTALTAFFAVTSADIAALRQAWQHLCPFVPTTVSETIFSQLISHYQAPTRIYHNLSHIKALLAAATRLSLTVNPLTDFETKALQYAIWFHDAIYDPQSSDNEIQSANYATTQLALLNDASELPLPALASDNLALASTTDNITLATEVARLVLLTQTHQTTANDRVGRLLLDLDLGILSTDFSHYQRYARAIRQEYCWLDDDRYCQGRQQVLKKFLMRPQIYLTPEFADQEVLARQNISAELALLSATGQTFDAITVNNLEQ
jgi:predicted metal-dependent HD superfamily phosphohydrolase